MTTEADTDAGEPAVDTTAPDVQENPVERIAAKLGWSPKDQWRGPEEKWVDAENFLTRTPEVLRELKDSNKRVIRATQDLINRERVKAIKDAEARYNAAREEGDVDAAIEARAELEEARKPDPSIADKQATFARENPWFNDNDDAHAIAWAAAERVRLRNGDIDDQFDAAIRAVKKAMPELFDSNLGERQPKSEPKPPAMHGGQRTVQAPAPKETWDAMPVNVRNDAEKAFVRTGMLTKDEFAASYWQEQKQ